MKANEAPEKIYCTPTEGGFYLTTIKPEPPFAEGVEYIKTDAFIERAADWLNNFYNEDTHSYLIDEDIEKFINYMKGE